MIRETFKYAHYGITVQKHSQIVEGHCWDVYALKCPSCEQQNEQLEHEDSTTCKCGLKMTRYADVLVCVSNKQVCKICKKHEKVGFLSNIYYSFKPFLCNDCKKEIHLSATKI